MTLILSGSTTVYLVLGIIFVYSINLKNELYRDLVIYYYNWTDDMQKAYLVYMSTSVILFWPLFFTALMLDKIVNFVNRNKSDT